MGNISAKTASTECSRNFSRSPRVVLDGGGPAECVTMGGVVEKRRQKDAKEVKKDLIGNKNSLASEKWGSKIRKRKTETAGAGKGEEETTGSA